MAEFKKYLGQEALNALVDQVKAEDAKTLQSAKDYCDSKDKNFESAGAAAKALADAKTYTDEKIAPLATTVALNAVDKKVDDEVARATAEEARIVKLVEATDEVADKAAEDVATLTQTHATDKAALEAKDAELAGAIEAVDAKVGEIPVVEGQETPATVIEYINKKTEGIATDAALAQLQSDLDAVEGEVATIKDDYLKGSDKIELANAIASEVETARAAEKTNADAIKAISDDYLKGEDKTELQGNIDAVSAVADAAVKQSDYDEKVTALEAEDARIAGLVATEATKAREEEGKLAARLVEVETFFKTAEGETLDEALDTLVELQTYLEGEGAVADQMLLDIAANKKAIEDHVGTDHDFAAADATLQEALEAEIAKKADKTTVEDIDGRLTTAEGTLTTVAGKVTTLEGEMDEVQGAVATKVEQSVYNAKVEELANADSAQVERIAALEAKFVGEGSVEDIVADAKQEAIDAAAEDATTKANAAKDAAIAKANELNTAMNTRVAELETASATHALKSDVEALAGKVTTAEGEIDTLQSEMDAVEAKSSANETAIGTLNTTVAGKAAQADLEAAVTRIATNEGAISTINTTLEDKAEQEDLDDAVERITAVETKAAANESAINSFVAISADEVNALFA